MKYTRNQLLALRPYGGNAICLTMRPLSGKHQKQIDPDASNLITSLNSNRKARPKMIFVRHSAYNSASENTVCIWHI